jgi:hypothetical protein
MNEECYMHYTKSIVVFFLWWLVWSMLDSLLIFSPLPQIVVLLVCLSLWLCCFVRQTVITSFTNSYKLEESSDSNTTKDQSVLMTSIHTT